MVAGGPPAFGVLLRQLRRRAGFSQETLAEQAKLSTDAVAALERGRRTSPRPSTVMLLATALDLGPPERAALLTAALGEPESAPTAPDPAAPATDTRPSLPVPPNALLGREAELAQARDLLRFPA